MEMCGLKGVHRMVRSIRSFFFSYFGSLSAVMLPYFMCVYFDYCDFVSCLNFGDCDFPVARHDIVGPK